MFVNRQLVALCVLATALLGKVPDAPGQTDVSLRTRAMGAGFAGVVEDLVTDAYLNPARLSAFSGTQLYMARHPRRTYAIPFTEGYLQRWGVELLPPEAFVSRSYSSAPYELTLFTALGASTRGAFSLALYSDTGENLSEDAGASTGYSNGSVFLSDTASGSRSEVTSFRLEGGLSTGDSPDDRSLGLRVVAARFMSNGGSVRSTDETRIYPVAEATSRYDFDRSMAEFTELDIVVSGGIYRPGTMMRELILAAGYSERQYDTEGTDTYLEDSDADGNGIGYNGPPEQTYRQSKLVGDRNYDGPVIRGRTHIDLTDQVVFTADGSFVHRTGGGDAHYQVDSQEISTTEQVITSLRTPYSYDGTDERYFLSGFLGYREELAPGVLFSLGGGIGFRRENFSEDGVGTMSVDMSGTSNVSVETPYTQKVWRMDDALVVTMPAGVEWTPIDVLALRLGLSVSGHRNENNTLIRRQPDTSSLPPELQLVSEERYNSLSHEIVWGAATGLGVNLAQRLFVDFLYQAESIYSNSSSVSFTSFNYLSLRFVF